MNKKILSLKVQQYLSGLMHTEVHRIALSKSPFPDVTSQELAGQVASKKKCEKKLPTWFLTPGIYYPALISVEQCSSETTALYKAGLIIGNQVLDVTGGFGVDTLYFAKVADDVSHCEINAELSEIAQHNAAVLGSSNITFLPTDGLEYLKSLNSSFSTVYIDPARRSQTGKVFLLKDCTPNVVEHLDLLLEKSQRIIIKTAPLLDITAGLNELKHVSEIQIISTKNECKELLFIVDKGYTGPAKITSVAINAEIKRASFTEVDSRDSQLVQQDLSEYIYEPDVALLKSGKFNAIANLYDLRKLDVQTQLYTSAIFNKEFPGRIFRIQETISITNLKKQKDLKGNVIVRSYPEKAEILIKQFKIKPADEDFLIFTKINNLGYTLLKTKILQYY